MESSKSTNGTLEPPKWFMDTRKKGQSTSGNLLFTVLRLADLPLQYTLLRTGHGLIRKLGGTPIAIPMTSSITALGLSPYQSLIWCLAAGSSAKQIFWCLVIGDNVFDPTFSTTIAFYNSLLNTVNTLLSVWALTSNVTTADTWTKLLTARPSHSTVAIGLCLYATGLWTEWWCEVQRKRFKQDPINKGKLFTGGLFGLARNINYGGYTLWHAGYAIVCAGLPMGVAMGAFLFGDFATRAVPYLETYLEQKYGAQWAETKRKVPYKLLPWIY